MTRQQFVRTKPHLNIGTMGHADHVKNTITGRGTVVTGAVEQGTIEVGAAVDVVGSARPHVGAPGSRRSARRSTAPSRGQRGGPPPRCAPG